MMYCAPGQKYAKKIARAPIILEASLRNNAALNLLSSSYPFNRFHARRHHLPFATITNNAVTKRFDTTTRLFVSTAPPFLCSLPKPRAPAAYQPRKITIPSCFPTQILYRRPRSYCSAYTGSKSNLLHNHHWVRQLGTDTQLVPLHHHGQMQQHSRGFVRYGLPPWPLKLIMLILSSSGE